MKTTKKNNPAAVGALLGILGATLYLLMKQMSGGNAPVTLTPAADTHADEAPKTTAALALQSLQRDPFDHPALHRAEKNGSPALRQTPNVQPAQDEAHGKLSGSKVSVPSANGSAVPVRTILLDHTQPHAALPVGSVPGVTASSGLKPTGSGADGSVQEAEDPLKGWHLTATIGGQYPRAVIEGAGIGIYRVGVGERIGTLEVAAIHEREIVLSDAHNLYTLSLMSGSSAPEDSKTSNDNKDARGEAMPPTTRENENGTAKIHP